MDKKIAGLLGAVAGLATMSAAQAATQPAPNRSEALQVVVLCRSAGADRKCR